MELQNLNKVLEKYGKDVLESYKKKLQAKGYRIADSLSVRVDVLGNTYNVVLSLSDYWKYIENGRRAGAKMPPDAPILKWIKDKGITANKKGITDKQMSFIIRRSISRKGIKPKQYLLKSTEEFDIVDELLEAFKIDLITDLRTANVQMKP